MQPWYKFHAKPFGLVTWGVELQIKSVFLLISFRKVILTAFLSFQRILQVLVKKQLITITI
jgi:hypothetical protein